MRRALDLHIGSVILLGAVTIATSVSALVLDPPPTEWLLFSVLGLVAGVYAVKIPGVNALVSASDTFFISSAMLFGPGPAMLSLAIDSAGLAYRRGYGVKRLLFNGTAPALSLWAATHVFEWMVGQHSLLDDSMNVAGLIPPLAAMTLVYFGLNSSLTAIAIALESRVALIPVWWRLAPLSLNYLAAASAAFCIVIVMRYGGPLAAGAVIPLVVVFHVTLRAILGRLADAECTSQKLSGSTCRPSKPWPRRSRPRMTSRTTTSGACSGWRSVSRMRWTYETRKRSRPSRPRRCCTIRARSRCRNIFSTSPAS